MVSLLSLLALPLVLVTQVVAAPTEPASLQRRLPNNQPSLTAITVRSGIHRRDELFRPKLDCEHHYAAGMSFYLQTVSQLTYFPQETLLYLDMKAHGSLKR